MDVVIHMSYLLEKLAARAVVKRWNDLSSKAKDKLRKVDPDSADAYNRYLLGADNRKKSNKIEYLGGKRHTFHEIDPATSKFVESLQYSSNPGAEFSNSSDNNNFLEGFSPIINHPSIGARRASSLLPVIGKDDAKQFRKDELFDSIVSRKGISALPKSLRDKYIQRQKNKLELTSHLTKNQKDIVRRMYRKQNDVVDSTAKLIDKGDNNASISHELSEIINGIRNIRSATKDGSDILNYAQHANQGIGTHAGSGVLIDEASQYHKLPEPVRDKFIRYRASIESVMPYSPDEQPKSEAAAKYKNMPQLEILRPGSVKYSDSFKIRKPVSNTQRRRILERASEIQKELFPNRETDFDVAKRRFPKWTKKRH